MKEDGGKKDGLKDDDDKKDGHKDNDDKDIIKKEMVQDGMSEEIVSDLLGIVDQVCYQYHFGNL